jgi:hypothetical protein
VHAAPHPAQVAFLALDVKGRVGAAATTGSKFEIYVARPAGVEQMKAKELDPESN